MKKKILFLTAFLPHPGAAAEKNTMLMLEDLSSLYDVDLIYFKYKKEKEYVEPNNHIRVVKVFENSLIKKFLNIICYPFVHPMFSVRFSWSVLYYIKTLVKKNKYDAIVCDHSQMFLYGKHIGTDIPKMLLSHDVIAQRVGRTSNMFMKWICIRSEKMALTVNNGHVFSFSQKDCDLITKYYNIPATLNLDYIDKKIVSAIPNEIKNEYIFIGKWSRADNLDGVIWFFKNVVPIIDIPITISIIGKGFPVDKITNANSNVRLNILGFVDNPYEIIANSRAVLSPLFTGAGIKVKVIEALGCGTPVLGTDIAFEGIDADKFGEFMILCETPDDYLKFMKGPGKSIKERIELKNEFINSYTSETIPHYISTHC